MAEENYPFDEVKPSGQASKFKRVLGGIILIWFLLVGFQVFKAWEDPYGYAESVYKYAKKAYDYFPEGERFYRKAVEESIRLYKLKETLLKSYPYRGELDFFLGVINRAWQGDKYSGEFLITLFKASFSKWLITLGLIYAVTAKTFLFFIVLFVLTIVFVIWKQLRIPEYFWIQLQGFRLAGPYRRDKDIRNVLKVLIANPRPASITHHKNYEGGLLEHSLAVAKRTVEICREKSLNPKDCFLAGLLHDIGKLKLYTKEGNRWVSLGTSQEVMNRIVLNELKKKFKIRDIPQEVQSVVKQADREITYREVWENFKAYEGDIKKLLKEKIRECNPLYAENLKAVIVKSICLNEAILEELMKLYPELHFEQHYPSSLPFITYLNPFREFVVLKVGDKVADKHDTFTVRIGDKTLKKVYLFKAGIFSSEELENFEKTEAEVV